MLIALLLMILIGGGAVTLWLKDKYSYGTEVMDLREYYNVEEDKRAIYLQDERLPEKALCEEGGCYLNLNFVKSYLNDGFYFDREEKVLLYTDALGSFEAVPGEKEYHRYGEGKSLETAACIMQGDSVYVALPYVALLSDFEYDLNAYRLRILTNWEPYQATRVTKETAIRYQGGIKSAILCDVAEGETVRVLEWMENWSKVENRDGIVGYMENKTLGEDVSVTPERKQAQKEYTAPEYTSKRLNEKVCLGFHAIGGVGGNATLEEMVLNAEGMNVIAPTWFSLNDNEGNFRDFGEESYVTRAHKYGLQVWGVWDDFNYENESGENIDDTLILSKRKTREKLVAGMVSRARELGLDGINLDFEKLGNDAGEAYGQFLRELSVECRKNDIGLSVDDYMPNDGNRQYCMGIQGKVTDYVILMGYDEHWHGSKDPGSVASIGFVSDGIDRALRDVPADKLVNALPFYTILWKLEGTNVEDEYLTLINQPDFIKRIGRDPVWDETTCQNYLEWTQGSKTYKIWFEDTDSISVKLNVMSAKDLAGVAAWRLGYGTQEIWTLLGAFQQL